MGHRHAGFNAKARSNHRAGPGKKTAVAEKPTGRPSPPSATSALLVADSVEEMNALAEATRLAADAPVLPAVAPAPTRPMTVDDMPMSSTRRKRLQRYIDKKLKKEERGELMRQLSASSFESPLIRATKSISKAKASVREQLRTALLEERAGLPRSDASVRLVRECVVDDGEFPETTAGFGNDMPASGAMESISSISSVQDISTTTTGVTNTVGAALRKAVPPTAPIGSALKRKVIIDCQLVSGKSSKQRMAESSSSSSSSSSDGDLSDDNAVNNDTAETMTSVADEAQPSKETNGATKFATSAPVMAPVPAPPAVTPSAPSPPTPPTPPAFVLVNRTDAVQAARLLLPVVAEEQLIMETIHDNAVTILCGETGSGKSTQLPQMLFEAGYGKRDGSNPGKIGVTQPRRVAAVSVAQRVGHELGLQKEVSYQIRYDGTVNNETVIKFMTDGVLLKEISRDFLLNDYSVLLIDEAHERSLNTDILIGLLSRVVVLRDKLSKDKALLRQQASLAHIKEVKVVRSCANSVEH